MSAANFFSELKRRQVYRGGVMYVVAGWVIVQVATTLFPIFNIPDWAIRLIVVGLIIGFPLALVALWMFESHTGRHPDAGAPAAAPPQFERRRGSDRGDAGIAQMMERERAERQQANEQLIAALDRIHSSQHDAHHAPHGPTPLASATSPPEPPAPRRLRIGTIFIAVFTVLLAAWVLWILVAPSATLPPVVETGKITHEYVMPAYQQVEQIGATLLEPLLRKLGIAIAPERVFTALMMVIALLVLRNLYRSMVRARRPRRGHA